MAAAPAPVLDGLNGGLRSVSDNGLLSFLSHGQTDSSRSRRLQTPHALSSSSALQWMEYPFFSSVTKQYVGEREEPGRRKREGCCFTTPG
ncbi:hypothetical protein MRX96_005111 [Rhipicephalus microplus]